jgi:peptide deformylase|tara:strand:- start:873 stop:1376 length:504 start_codon:yes stop_codon:yes gene_type:complete
MQIYHNPYETLFYKSSPWTSADAIEGYDDIEKFERDMTELMHKSNGIGLAANQIGITKRFFAMGSDRFDTFKKSAIIWNPQIKKFSKEKVFDLEGCLSFPGIWVNVERPKTVEVQYETTQGETKTARLDAMESKCFQHELDHLDGVTFNSRVSKLRWDMAKKKAGKD